MQTDLDDTALEILNAAAEAAVVSRWGGNYPTPILKSYFTADYTLPDPTMIFLDRKVSTATAYATLITALTGANNDLAFASLNPGVIGNSISIAYVVAGLNTPLSVEVTNLNIVVNVATDGAGVPTSTASQVLAALNASVDASVLVTAALAAGNDGTGIVTAMPTTLLSGGIGGVGLITEYWGDVINQSVSYLIPNDYMVRYGGYAIERWGTGSNRRWNYGHRVDISYVPEDDTPQRKQVISELIRLAIRHTGVKSESIGDESTTSYESYAAEQKALIDSLHSGIDFS